MNPTRNDYLRELKTYLEGKPANESILRTAEEQKGIPEQDADDFRRSAIQFILGNKLGPTQALKILLPNLPE